MTSLARSRPVASLLPVAPSALGKTASSAAAPGAAPDGSSLARYLTHREAASYLRLSPRTLDALVAEGQIHPARAGRRKRLYAPEILDDYLRLSGSRRSRPRRPRS